MNPDSNLPRIYGEFCLKLRSMDWDRALFRKLFLEMREYCEANEGKTEIDREVAEVFWNASWWVKQQIGEIPDFESEYFENAIINLDHLAWYVFAGIARSHDEYEPL